MYYHDDGKIKFSGWVSFYFHDDIMECEDYDIVYEKKQCGEDADIEYDIFEQFKESEHYKIMENNNSYYLYFEGEVFYWHEETMDGTEYDAEVIVNYFNVDKLEHIQ